MSPDEYIKTRLEDQIEWYSRKSSEAQCKYKVSQTIEIITAAAIPILTSICAVTGFTSVILSIIIGGLGSIIAVIESICKMNKYHENWIQYRYISELLKHEKYLFQTHAAPYDDDDSKSTFSFLVQRVERTISSENVNWVGINEDEMKNPL